MATLVDLARRIAQDMRRIAQDIKPLRYDSGPRNVTTEFLSTFTSDAAHLTLQRVGRLVSCSLYVRRFDKSAAPSGTDLFTLPVGWRPRVTYRVPGAFPTGTQFTVNANGTVSSHGADIPLNTFVTFKFDHITADPIPTTLPGSNA